MGTLTLFSPGPVETDKNDETYSTITNDDFLAAIFGNVNGERRPVVTGFLGNPGRVASRNWFGKPWLSGETVLSIHWNNYFSLASFLPDEEGKYRRKKKNFATLHAIMLDDIGTKAAGLDRLTLHPSWLLETSPGNFQAGYILKEPLADGKLAVQLVKAIIAAGLCDPGADGPLARYARLPVGVNGKHEPQFACRLAAFHPDRRYTVEQIVDGLELDLISQDHGKRHDDKERPSTGKASADEEVYVLRGEENPVIARIKERNLYIKPLGNAKHEIECPWQSEHTGGIGGGTAYFEPSESFPLGGFKCQHGHCANRHMRDLRDFLGISKSEAKHRSTIRVAAGELAPIVDCCERELARVGRYYQRGGLIVTIRTDPGTKESAVVNLSLPSVVRALSSIACFEKFNKRETEWADCDPPERHCKVLFDSTNYPHLPVLMGLARQPYLRPDGSLMAAPDYDPATGMFGLFAEHDFCVAESPSRQDAERALREIDTLLDEFAFKFDYDRSAALSAILTAAIRPSLPLAPMVHVTAPQIASGKSYLTELISAFAAATVPSGIAFPADDEECRKLLLASLLTAPAVLCFDNLTSDLIPYKSLCSALTEEYITGRILGVSKTATVGTKALFLSSGNNVGPIRDMARRTITISLDPACEIPATRDFKKQPVSMVKAARGRYVTLALTIIRAWIVAGRPISKVKSVATYTDWSELCRQPLLWLGRPDPATSIFVAITHDPDREALGHLLHAWQDCFGNRPVMIREAATNPNIELREAIMDIASERGDVNRRRLGKWISRHASRIVDGLKFEKDSGTRSAEAWMVQSVTSITSVFDPPSPETVVPCNAKIVRAFL